MVSLLIAIPSNTGRFVLPVPFTISLAEMIANAPKDLEINIHYFGGLRIDAVRNQIVEYAKSNAYDYLLFLDDDMAFPKDTIKRLMDHKQPIVSGLYGAKSMPFHYFVMPEDNKPPSSKDWLLSVEPKLYPVKTLATGCLLIKMEIFEIIPRPYFILRMDQFGRITQTEDCFFGIICRMHNIPMFVDATLQCQHLKTVAFPHFWENAYHSFTNMPTSIKKESVGYNLYPTKIIPTAPKAGYQLSDGIDDCAHERQTKMANGLYICRDCGQVYDGQDFLTKSVPYTDIEELERITDESN